MKNRTLLYAILIFIAGIVQVSVLNNIKILSVKPNLLLVMAIVIALDRNDISSIIFCFFTGLMQDALTGKSLGYYALMGLILGLIITFLGKKLYNKNAFIVLIFTFMGSIFYEVMIYFSSIYFKQTNSFWNVMFSIILVEAIYNTSISILVYLIFSKLSRRLNIFENENTRYF